MARILKARRPTADNDDKADEVIDRQTVDDEFTSSDHSADALPERIPLGQLLVEAGLLSQDQVHDALQEGSLTGERLGEIAVRRKLVTEDDVARVLATQWGLDYVERSSIWFDPAALARLSREDAQELEALPTRVQDGRVVVAVAEPTEQRLAALRDVIGDETVMVVVPKSALEAGLRSDLLASRGHGHAVEHEHADERPPPELEAVPDEPPQPELEVEPEAEPEPEPEPELEPELPPVAELPVRPRPRPRPADDGEGEADAVMALANEARAVAERLAEQAAAVRAQAHEQHELRAQAEAYESRIGELEHELESQRSRVNRVRDQLATLLAAFDD